MISDILFIMGISILFLLLAWEFIPDGWKQYWDYLRQVRRDKKEGKRKRYSFIWKR